jgi:hypothetical protein
MRLDCDWENLEREMSFVKSRDQNVDDNGVPFIIDGLDMRLPQKAPRNICGILIIARSDGTAHGLNMQAMRTGFLSCFS